MHQQSKRKDGKRRTLIVGDQQVTLSAIERRKDGVLIGFRAKIPTTRRNGQQQYHWVSATTVDALFDEARQWLEQNPDPSAAPGKAAHLKVSGWFDYWFDRVLAPPAVLPKGSRWKWCDSTVINYRKRYLKHVLPRIGNIALRDLTLAHLERDLVDDMVRCGVGAPTIKITIGTVKMALDSATLDKHRSISGLRTNPARFLTMPREIRSVSRPKYQADLGQVFHLLDVAEGMDEPLKIALPLLIVHIGLRKGEALGLKWGDLDLTARRLQLARQIVKVWAASEVRERLKNRAPGELDDPIDLPDVTVEALRQHALRLKEHRLKMGKRWKGPHEACAPEAWVFPNPDGTPMAQSTIDSWFERLCKAAGVTGKSLHKLRHDCASFHRSIGTPDDVIQRLLRHKDPATLYRYYAHPTTVHAARAGADNMDALMRRRTG